MAEMKELRYSHTEGLTLASFDKTGKYLLTAGADGDVRVYKGLDDDDHVSFRVGTCVTAIDVKNDEIAVATECNDVKTYLIPEGTQQDILVRFTAQVNSICFARSKELLAAGSSDFSIKIVNKEDNSQKPLNGHEAPILCVLFSPDDEFLASSCCDGNLKIWDVSTQECIKTLNIFPKCNDTSTSKTLCKIAWCHGKEQVIAAPNDKGVKLISTSDWTELCILEGFHMDLVSLVACSPCGNYLASSSVNGEIVTWDVSQRKKLEFMKHETGSKITAIDWNPNGSKEILYADDQGQFSVCSDVIPQGSQNNQFSTLDLFDDSDHSNITTEKPRKRAYQSDDDDDDGLPVGSAHKKHRVQNMDNFLDDEADDDDDDDPEISINLIKEGLLPKGPRVIEDDDGEDSLQDFIVEEKPKKPTLPQINLQKSFQPGSTPAHLMHRFMTWNSVGIIRCHSEDEVSTIDIEFHDASLHHPLHFTNVMNHSMASLSSTAAVLACESQDDVPSKFVCLHFGTWDSTKEWTMSMPKGEEIKNITVNQKYIAVATDVRLVRIFTVGGLQYQLISIPGPIVSMAMSETQIMIVYHQGTGLPDCQCLGMRLIEIGKTQWKTTVEHQLPLSKKATLIWIGFSLEETPFMVDSRGNLRMLQRSFGNTWIPVLNLKSQTKTKSDNYWIIGITEYPPEARAVLCKGANFPATLPRPVPSALNFEIPLCDKETEKGQMEQDLLRNRITNGYHEYYKKKGFEEDESAINEGKTTEIQLLMKLFALSCKSDRIFRAVEICELMPNAETVNLAIQYATRMRRMNLAQRLDELARRKSEEEEEAVEDENSDDDDMMEERGRFGSLSQNRRMPTAPLSRNSFNASNTRTITLNGKRSIGRPQARSRTHRDSLDDSLDGSDNENGNIETKNNEDNDDVDMEEGAEDIEIPDDDDDLVEDSPKKPIGNANGSSSGQGRSNPFKLSQKTQSKTQASSRGTSYFESLTSTMPLKNKPASSASKEQTTKKSGKQTGKSSAKQATLFQKKSPASDKKSKETEKNTESSIKSKKTSGFALFREHFTAEETELDNEELVKKSLEEWKNLPADEKKSWNMKAKGEPISGDASNGEKSEKIVNEANGSSDKGHVKSLDEVKAKTNASAQNTKSKLAAFAFQK
eukprot:Seg631.2 transcript_id=Seg631.2/GoldUCD/mRNA.D3Y31 product="WD repeat and HMG-box DNA-binding protein 1" protein_id=Seg631.2/GoldUCD/D3Y31